MEPIYNWLNTLINKNRNEFSAWKDINWLTPYAGLDYQMRRDLLLKQIEPDILFKGTKPYHYNISKGCEICAAGNWSCLFITNICNAKCFYCPAPQNKEHLPSTQGVSFESASEYSDYIKYFDFRGVSFSVGEPFLRFDMVIEYLKTLRKKCNDDLYIWLYTNGILTDKKKLNLLAEEGINEVRFDIGAVNNSIEKVRLAKNIIPNITIEVPAVPEEKEQILALLPKMAEAGVTNLNLHQMRLTHHNAKNIVNRGYTIINAEQPIVLESEIAALEIINKVKELDLDIGINYCSFHYKNRFQKAGYRSIITKKMFPETEITKNGYLREYDGKSLTYSTIKFSDYNKNNEGTGLLIGSKLYKVTTQSVFSKSSITKKERNMIDALIKNEPADYPIDDMLFKIWQFEYIENGLREI